MGGGASKHGIAMKDHKLVLEERDELASAHKAKEKMLALLSKDHEQLGNSLREHKKTHLDVVALGVDHQQRDVSEVQVADVETGTAERNSAADIPGGAEGVGSGGAVDGRHLWPGWAARPFARGPLARAP